MKRAAAPTPKPDNQLWGIYHVDREYARELGDPLRTVIEAPTKLIAEETAVRLGFGDPLALPVTSEQAEHAQWIYKYLHKHRQRRVHKHSRGIHL